MEVEAVSQEIWLRCKQMNNNGVNNQNSNNNAQQENTSNGTVPKFCPNCGTKTNGAKFCPECGTKLF